MLLRSITKHVQDQNWFAVALDFVIVVFGVFIGLQVANWNQGVADRRLGQDYVERLADDLRKDLETFRRSSDYYGAVFQSALAADQLLADPTADPRETVIQVYRATETSFYPARRATWDQIVSSGHLGLLPEAVIASDIADYYSLDLAENSDELATSSPYRRKVRSIIPISVQVKIRKSCSDVADERGAVLGFEETCELDVDADTLRMVADSLRADPDIQSTLRVHYSDFANIGFNTNGTIVMIGQMLDALDVALE